MSSSEIPAKLSTLVARFKRHSDPKLRYQQLLSYAKKLQPLPEEDKVPENKVKGCVSQVYISARIEDGKVVYSGDSDAQLVKGLVAFLIEGLNGLTPEEILKVSPDFIAETGLNASLTPSRANGFYNTFQMMKQKALNFQVATTTEQN
ncbi:SufE family protein [Oscillatoria sp. FACHB-1406]|uniref:SufE family protein n=1 Tax=Oscillatoria sp. FACHB-1406 TaxID=2692846 RepID=UPI001687424C|nr:SufE family protein [Oscillatoria sp. FACHB-1406]MBD2576418.1 SufE family protein [Oscillatoria sp. FACHB-1406]